MKIIGNRNLIISFLIGFLVLLMFILSIKVYKIESQKREVKEDLIELSGIEYGLFNVDQWTKILAGILTKKIEDFNVDESNYQELYDKISSFLYEAIDEFEIDYYEENKKESLFGLSFQNMGASVFGVFPKLKEQVPQITEDVIAFLNDPENREKIRQYLLGKLDEYAEETFAEIDYTSYNQILDKYDQQDYFNALTSLSSIVRNFDERSKPFNIIILFISIITIVLLLFVKDHSNLNYGILIIIAFILLLMGLLLPMIEIDARISEMSFNLLGEKIIFSNQVLYFKSKSILEVVQLMLLQKKLDLFIVGFLVLLFSVLFPLTKLVSSVIFLLFQSVRNNHFIKFMIFKTGKWSMADVMVIAIFMAYIGFSGIISEQLKQLEGLANNLEILTTNESNLQIGFFFFTAFVILSLMISYRINNQIQK